MGKITRQLIHFQLLLFMLEIQQLHIRLESFLLFPHVLDVLALLLELVACVRDVYLQLRKLCHIYLYIYIDI
jgi:hypothetical protein